MHKHNKQTKKQGGIDNHHAAIRDGYLCRFLLYGTI